MKRIRATKAELLARLEALEARVRALEADPPPARDDASSIVDRALRRAAARARGTIRYKQGEAVARVKARIAAEAAAIKALQRAEKRKKRRAQTE